MRSHSLPQTPVILLVFLFAGGMINYMDRAVIGLLGPTMRTNLGLSAGQFGIAMSAFSVGYTLFTLVGGWATDRLGAAPVLFTTMLVWSISAGMTGAVWGMSSLVLVRFLFGIGEAPFFSAFNKLLASSVPRERFSTYHSLCSCGQPLGGALAGPLMGLVTATFGWRAGFFAAGAIGLMWVVLWLVTVGVHGSEAVGQPLPVNSAVPEAVLTRSMVMRNGTIWVCIAAMACATYLLVFFFSWFPSYLSATYHLAPRTLGLVSALPWLVGVFGYASGGALSDWLAPRLGGVTRARRLMIILCLGTAGFIAMVVPFTHSLIAALVLMSIAMGLMYLAGSTYFAIGLSATPASLVGFVSGVFLFVANVAATVSPALSGYLIQWTGRYDTSFLIAGALPVAASLAALLAIKPEHDSVFAGRAAERTRKLS